MKEVNKMIQDIIEDWLKKEKENNFVEYYDLDSVTLDGINFDLNDLKDKLLQSIVEMIDEYKKEMQGIAGGMAIVNKEVMLGGIIQACEDLKAKLLEGKNK